MLPPTTVWLVRAGSTKETQGRLSADADAVTFAPRGADAAPLVIPRSAIRDVRRLRGTPVMRLIHADRGEEVILLLYFAEPPPLPGSAETSNPSFIPRRGLERAAAGMRLRAAARQQRVNVEMWVRELRS